MSLIVPLLPIPKQHLSIQLSSQQTDIWLRQLRTGLFMDIALNGAVLVSNVICENLNIIIRETYLGYSGDFAFYDTQGSSDPDYTGLGDANGGRFQLRYLTADEVTAALAAAKAAVGAP